MSREFLEDLKKSNIIKNISEIKTRDNLIVVNGRVCLNKLFPELFKNIQLDDNLNHERFQIIISINGKGAEFRFILTPATISESSLFEVLTKDGSLAGFDDSIGAIRYMGYNGENGIREILAYSIINNCLCIDTREDEQSVVHFRNSINIKKKITKTFDLKKLYNLFDEYTITKACSYFFNTLCEKIEIDKELKLFRVTRLATDIHD